MDEATARAILDLYICPDNGLADGFHPKSDAQCDNEMSWQPSDNTIVLSGTFDAQDLEAIAWWMRNK